MGDLDHLDYARNRPVRSWRNTVAVWISVENAAAGLAFLLMVAYWPNTSGAATTLRWSLLWIGLPLICSRSGVQPAAVSLSENEVRKWIARL